MRSAGMQIVMVETGDDPGHAASRATYESIGFERWPVARYFRELRIMGLLGDQGGPTASDYADPA